jgi:hypothetical protein
MTRLKTLGRGGQVLTIFAGSLVVLLVIGALVVDLGFVFMIHRQEQNAADPGAIAAARYIRAGGGVTAMRDAACLYAHQNGFFGGPSSTVACTVANDPNGTSLTVNFPPSANAGRFAGTPGYVEVVISRPHRSFLGQIVGLGQFTVTSSAVAAFGNQDGNSNSLVALDPGGCGSNAAGVIDGGGTIKIEAAIDPSTGLPYDGGYVQINSVCGSTAMQNGVCGNGEGSGALKINGSGSNLIAPKVLVSGTCVKANNNFFNAPLTEGAVQIGDPLADLAPPSFAPPGAYCGQPGDTPPPTQTSPSTSNGCKFNKKDGIYDLSPGVYYGGWQITGSGVTLHLQPGIYVIAGGGIDLGASGTITSVVGTSGTPAPVMIFSTDNPAASCPGGGGGCQGKIKFTAGSDLLLRAIDSGPYKGILLWQDGRASCATATQCNDIVLSGQVSLSIAGTIYNPRGVVTVDGGGIASGYAAVQIISWNWKVSGGGTILMPYDPKQLYQFNSKGLVK